MKLKAQVRWKIYFRSIFVLFLLALPLFGDEPQNAGPSADAIWNQMVEQSFSKDSTPIRVQGTQGKITFGAEKEGSSGLITRVMGPKAEIFQALIKRFDGKNGDNKELFLREFMQQFVSGKSRQNVVTNAEGQKVTFEMNDLKAIDYSKASVQELEKYFQVWLDRAGDQSFAFLKPSVRMQLFKGTFPGMSAQVKLDAKHANRGTTQPVGNYQKWVPLFGEPQKYIESAHNTGNGWELNFHPQSSYGEFEKMIDWFRSTLKNADELFEAPGHQRLVFPKRDGTPEETQKLHKQLGEMYKHVQAYIILKGLLGQTSIETSNHKSVIPDAQLENIQHNTGRGVIRLENNRFPVDGLPTLSIELRSGTKTDSTRRFVEQIISSRYASNNFDGLMDSVKWELISKAPTAEDLVARFGVSRLEAQKALQSLQNPQGSKVIDKKYLVPFWNWENSPYLSPQKKKFLRELTTNLIKTAASWENNSLQDNQQALAAWIRSSDLVETIESILIPKPQLAEKSQNGHQFHRARSELPHLIDVNKIDLGIEYTGAFPIKLSAIYDQQPQDSKPQWLRTQYDLTPLEREKLVKQAAELLGKEIKGTAKPKVHSLSEGSHGHSIQLAYELKDAQGRKWRIEWDGVGRDYDPTGKVIPDSIRGGHLEMVTPKFNPSTQDIEAVYKTFKTLGFLPKHRSGGGHINIDLAPFENNPKAMARFISKFLEHRGMISLMFQDPRRVRTGEPNETSQTLINALRDFNGTEEELKQLLYNERFFNSRIGRKTQYVQLNLNAYFQDVIPEQFLNKDFDIKNAPWRENFSVDPKIRKAELRLFNAPETPNEAQSQIKLVRSLLDFALNDTAPLTGHVGKVQHEHYAKNSQLAVTDFEKMVRDLHLDPKEYAPYLWNGMETTRAAMESENYLPISEALALFTQQTTWDKAVSARPQTHAIDSETRDWDPTKVNLEAKKLQEERLQIRQVLEQRRDENKKSQGELNREAPSLPLELTMSDEQLAGLPMDRKLLIYYLRLRSSLFSEEQKHKINAELKTLEKSEDFGNKLAQVISEAVTSGKRDFPIWAANLTLPKPQYYETLAEIIASPEEAVRQIGLERIEQLTPKQVATFLLEQSSSLSKNKFFLYTDTGETLLKKIEQLKNIPKEEFEDLTTIVMQLISPEAPGALKRKFFERFPKLAQAEMADILSNFAINPAANEKDPFYFKLLEKIPSLETILKLEQYSQRYNTTDLLKQRFKNTREQMEEKLAKTDLTTAKNLSSPSQLFILFQKEKQGALDPEAKRLLSNLFKRKNSTNEVNDTIKHSLKLKNVDFQLWLSQFIPRAPLSDDNFFFMALSPNQTIRERTLETLKNKSSAEIKAIFDNQFWNKPREELSNEIAAHFLQGLLKLHSSKQAALFDHYHSDSSQNLAYFLRDAIGNILKQSTNEIEVQTAIQALSKLNNQEVVPLLKELIANENPRIKEVALSALEKKDSPEAYYFMRELIRKDPTLKSRYEPTLAQNQTVSTNLLFTQVQRLSVPEQLRTLYSKPKTEAASKLIKKQIEYQPYQMVDAVAEELKRYRATNDPMYRRWLVEEVLNQFPNNTVEAQRFDTVKAQRLDLVRELVSDPISEIRKLGLDLIKSGNFHEYSHRGLLEGLVSNVLENPHWEGSSDVLPALMQNSFLQHVEVAHGLNEQLLHLVTQPNSPSLFRQLLLKLARSQARSFVMDPTNERLAPSFLKFAQSPLKPNQVLANSLLSKITDKDWFLLAQDFNFYTNLEILKQQTELAPLVTAIHNKLKEKLEALTSPEIQELITRKKFGLSFLAEHLAPNSSVAVQMKAALKTAAGTAWLRETIKQLAENDFQSLPVNILNAVIELDSTQRKQALSNVPAEKLVDWMLASHLTAHDAFWMDVLTDAELKPSYALAKKFETASAEHQKRIALLLGRRAHQADEEAKMAIEVLKLKDHPLLAQWLLPRDCSVLFSNLHGNDLLVGNRTGH